MAPSLILSGEPPLAETKRNAAGNNHRATCDARHATCGNADVRGLSVDCISLSLRFCCRLCQRGHAPTAHAVCCPLLSARCFGWAHRMRCDACSFYALPSSILNNPTYQTLFAVLAPPPPPSPPLPLPFLFRHHSCAVPHRPVGLSLLAHHGQSGAGYANERTPE